jgi:hypothetical protein
MIVGEGGGGREKGGGGGGSGNWVSFFLDPGWEQS